MNRRSAVPSGIGMALRQHEDAHKADNFVGAGEGMPLSLRDSRDRPVSRARTFSQLGFRVDGVAKSTSGFNVDGTDCTDIPPLSPTRDGIFREFCRGQPPKRSFLGSEGGTPPRLRMSRRSTLSDKPESVPQLKAIMVQYKGEQYLPLDLSTVHRLTQYLNGSKPLLHVCVFKRLLVDTLAYEVRAELFVAILEHIGQYCEHLAIVAPFYAIEFGHISYCEVGNAGPGSDWDKLLECFPNVCKITFEDRMKEPTNLTRDTFFSLNFALANNTTLQEYVKTDFDGPNRLLFDFHHDFHCRQRPSSSPNSLNYISTPLIMIVSGIVYADGAENFGSLDEDSVFGKVEDIDSVDG